MTPAELWRRWLPDVWQCAAISIAVFALLPLIALAWTAAQGSDGLWPHLLANVLPRAAANTVVLLLGVGILSVAMGVGSAWLVTAYDFPGRRVIAWALLLPLAVPTYIVAYAYLDLLHPLGPIQSVIRALLGHDSPRDFRLPDIRGLFGCIVLMGFVLYPYVYLTVRAMFMTQAAGLLEAARTLGSNRAGVFWRVALPMARPAIAVGLSLVLLETLNDIGASEFLGVQTLTVSVYTTWITRGDLPGAAQIALIMLVVVAALVTLERLSRHHQRYASVQRPRAVQPQRLRGMAAIGVLGLTTLPVLVGFVAPTCYLLVETWQRMNSTHGISSAVWSSAWNTLRLAGLATVATLVAGLLLAWAVRLSQARRNAHAAGIALRIGSLGYAVPGTVLAIGLLVPLAGFDTAANWLLQVSGAESRMLLMGSIWALVLAYVLRFMAISAGGIEAGWLRVPQALDQAARSLGASRGKLLWRVHLPLLRPAMAAAALLVFVDAMKELPATLLLRPLNVETLATWLYADAARGAYEEGAVAALLIVLAGLLPVILLARTGLSEVPKDAAHD